MDDEFIAQRSMESLTENFGRETLNPFSHQEWKDGCFLFLASKTGRKFENTVEKRWGS